MNDSMEVDPVATSAAAAAAPTPRSDPATPIASRDAPATIQPHAFHCSLPPHHKDPDTHRPYITTYCQRKAEELYQLAMSIRLTEDTMFYDRSSTLEPTSMATTMTESPGTLDPASAVDPSTDPEEDDDDEFEDGAMDAGPTSHCRLAALGRQCARLQAQLAGLEQLKYSGLTQKQLGEMILHLIHLVMASYDPVERKLYFERVGEMVTVTDGNYVLAEDDNVDEPTDEGLASRREQLHREMERPFALPTPTREVLLLTIMNILSNKGPLRAVSNAALYVPGSTDERLRLVLHWRAFLRTLLRTAPYLDEHKQTASPSDSHTRQSNIIKRTSQMIRDARHFFDQRHDRTARQVWAMVRRDCLYQSHTHAGYRGTIVLYLFQPSRCSPAYYQEVLPQWLDCWTNIDRCPEYDFLWLTLLCRARKHVEWSHRGYDWGPIRRRLLTHAQYWLQLPIGGTAMDKSFPRAPNPRSRACPSRLKVFTGTNSSYEEGIDFVAKVVKLLVTGLGSGRITGTEDDSTVPGVSEGTAEVLRFLTFVTPYFNPSNVGSWTFTLGAFLHYFAYELCCRLGAAAGLDALRETHPALAVELGKAQPGVTGPDIPAHEVVALLDALLPLCQQAIYSKNGHVGRAGEAAMLYLVQIDPVRTTPAFIDFAASALDAAAINMSHQAPAAISALTGLIQPSLRSDSTILLSRLPDILRLSLAGIDSNDQHKCIRTLIFYRSLTSWIPIGGTPETWAVLKNDKVASDKQRTDGTRILTGNLFRHLSSRRDTAEFKMAVENLSDDSLMKKRSSFERNADRETRQLLLEEASSAMGDWALEFLERVFGLLRASGEREKRAKMSSGVASRHSSADVHQARNFSRVLTECMMQVFAAMSEHVHELAVQAVNRFLQEETLIFAAKDAAIVCQAAAAARLSDAGTVTSPGLDTLIGTLTQSRSQHSVKTLVYRFRCLTGAVKSAGFGIIKHQELLTEAISFALASDDRHLLKTGCKLLRHTLATLAESYPVSTDLRPRLYYDESGELVLGRSAQLYDDPIKWHVPDTSCVLFFANLFSSQVSSRLEALCSVVDSPPGSTETKLLRTVDIVELRRCLRVFRYSIRGGAGLLLDMETEERNPEDMVPYENSSHRLLDLIPLDTRSALLGMRARLCTFLIALSSVIASDTLHSQELDEMVVHDPHYRTIRLISSDPKVCKECCDISLLLLTRRGAAFRAQEGRTIWKAQKQLATDFSLCAEVDRMAEALQMGKLYGNSSVMLFKDGENAGKSISRRLLVSRVHLFHNLLQRNASFQVPRRLRRLEREHNLNRKVLYTVELNISELLANRERILAQPTHRALDLYEGIVDCLFALCCHSNTQVRASAISVIDYALTRFGWILGPRIPRLLSGLTLQDINLHGRFGVPSCSKLSGELNQQGKRKRLAEAIKGVCSVLSLPRSVRQLLGSWQFRFQFVQAICCTEELTSLLPAEELQKIIHYLQAIFSPFRSSIFILPVTNTVDADVHHNCICFIEDILAERNLETENSGTEEGDGEGGRAHWRKLLFAAWFLLNFINKGDLDSSALHDTVWCTCTSLIENNMGQPLQRVALGMLAKLCSISNVALRLKTTTSERLICDSFCINLARALVYDHKEDNSVGGGHKSQWSSGIENILRDASRHLALKSLFPFQRASQSLAAFKASHAQLLEEMLINVKDVDSVLHISKTLLSYSKELVAAPPSEDQRNQQITSAEIFAGVCKSCVRTAHDNDDVWTNMLLPHVEYVVMKVPFSLCGAYFDAFRYILSSSSAPSSLPLVSWIADRIRCTLWPRNPSVDGVDMAQGNGQGSGTEGFTIQSKWLHLFSAVIIELDESDLSGSYSEWYECALLHVYPTDISPQVDEHRGNVWVIVTEKVVPCLMDALSHPFDSCRDHIARTLFWVCFCQRRFNCRSRTDRIDKGHKLRTFDGLYSPSQRIIEKFLSYRNEDFPSLIDKYNALNTTRRFITYCVLLGEVKFEYSDNVIPLLPLVFESLNSTSDDDSVDGKAQATEENTSLRTLEAEVIKSYRYLISDISITAVLSHGNDLDVARVLDALEAACSHEKWQVRQGGANFLRCFQYAHKFLLNSRDAGRVMTVAIKVLADERREVSSAGMAALTGILAASPPTMIGRMVKEYARIANRSKLVKPKKGAVVSGVSIADLASERQRARDQQVAVFFLVATVMSQPYDTPTYVPQALEAISRHSYERSAPLGVRDTVKKCCAEYKRTHMSDNWEVHRSKFTQEQLEAFEDVISTPHYYA